MSDQNTPPFVHDGQEFALVVFVGPETFRQSAEKFAVMVLGCFRSAEESNNFARKLVDSGYDKFDMYTVQTRQFLPLPPPPPQELNDVHYPDKLLNRILRAQREQAEMANTRFNKRLEGENQNDEKKMTKEEAEAKNLDNKPSGGVKCVIGKPLRTAPEGVDLTALQKLKL